MVFAVVSSDCMTGDRGFSTASGIEDVAELGDHVMAQVNTSSLHFLRLDVEALVNKRTGRNQLGNRGAACRPKIIDLE